jgi:ankyrin repeat protein
MAYKKLMDLPPEIQETIYLYSHNDHLDVVNKTFNTLSHSYRLIAQKLLLKYSIQKPNIPNEKWINLIQDRQFNSDIAKALFNLGYNTKEMTEIMIEYSTTRGDLKLLTFILDDWRNLGVENLQVIKNRALIQCSIFGHVDLIQLLLQRGAEVNYDHDASISMAAKYGKTKAARLLIDSGCDIHVDEEYPLCWASRGYIFI